jgi:hypothetical protein
MPLENKWKPTDGCVTHGNSRIHPKSVFWVAPDATLGKILSAYSNRNPKDPAIPGLCYVAAIAILLIVGLNIFVTAGGLIPSLLMIAIISIYISVLIIKNKPYCTFIGEKGMMIYRKKSKGNIDAKILIFENKNSVTVELINKYKNGFYIGTDYTYHFFDESQLSKTKLEIKGMYFASENFQNPRDTIYFAQAAEKIIYTYALTRALQHINEGKSEVFQLIGKHGVQYEISVDSKGVRVTQEKRSEYIGFHELKTFTVENGIITIRHNRHSSSKLALRHADGEYIIPYSKIPNGEVAIRLVKHYQEAFNKDEALWTKAA